MKKNMMFLCSVLLVPLVFTGCGYSYAKEMTIMPVEICLTEQDLSQITAGVSSVAQRHGYTSDEKAVASYNKHNDKEEMLCIYTYGRKSKREQVGLMAAHIPSNSTVQIRAIVYNIAPDEKVEADMLNDITEELSKASSLSCGNWHTAENPDPLVQAHIRQGQWLGIFYIPAHIIGGATSLIWTGTWNDANFMEAGPLSIPPRPW